MMKRREINIKVKQQLWGLAAGRCEICNKLVYSDCYYGKTENLGEIAHICGVKGPRHNSSMSSKQIDSIDNLMLLCHDHHKLIDTQTEKYPAEMLLEMKKGHEERIRIQTDVKDTSSCQIVSYFMDIDNVELVNNEELFRRAVIKSSMYPGTSRVIALNNRITTLYTPSPDSIRSKAEELEGQVKYWYSDIVGRYETIAIFALAPQPLLFKLGSLLPDQLNVKVFQCHHEDEKWTWPEDYSTTKFVCQNTKNASNNTIALVIDLSAQISDDRVTQVLGDCCIYHITINNPNRGFVRNEFIQNSFIQYYRATLEKIRGEHSNAEKIHLFPAMPSSLAIRAGMDLMTKVDLPILIYDQLQQGEAFIPTITIGG